MPQHLLMLEGLGEGHGFVEKRVRLWHIALQQRQAPQRAEAIGHFVTAPARLEDIRAFHEERRGPRKLAVLDQAVAYDRRGVPSTKSQSASSPNSGPSPGSS